eukprot:m.204534 g.204534  ORF g.204534 m.204534 type:complete len:1118 (+) comp15529_c0_seq1:392-3745(+)
MSDGWESSGEEDFRGSEDEFCDDEEDDHSTSDESHEESESQDEGAHRKAAAAASQSRPARGKRKRASAAASAAPSDDDEDVQPMEHDGAGPAEPPAAEKKVKKPPSASKVPYSTLPSDPVFMIFFDLETANNVRTPCPIVEFGARIVYFDESAKRADDSKLRKMLGRQDRAPNLTFHSKVKPPETVEWNTFCIGVHKITKSSVQHAPTINVVLRDFVVWLQHLHETLGAFKGHKDKNVVFCLAGHNITSCDLDFLFMACHENSITLPDFVVAFWDTLSTAKGAKIGWMKKNVPGGDAAEASGAGAAADEDDDQVSKDSLSCSALYTKCTHKQPVAAHSVLGDIEMNVSFALEPTFWSKRLNKTGIMQLAPLWASKAQKLAQQLSTGDPDSRVWEKIKLGGFVPPEDVYTGPSRGPTSTHPAGNPNPTTTADLFLSFLTKDFITTIIERSTFYALEENVVPVLCEGGTRIKSFKRVGPNEPGARKRVSQEEWLGMTHASVLTFFSILLRMGVEEIGTIKNPWSTEAGTRVGEIADHMKLDAFRQHLHCIHFEDHTQQESTHPLRKILPLLSLLRETFPSAWTSGMSWVLDETSISYKGHLSLKQFNPSKPDKHHIKVHSLVDGESGFYLSFYVYTGKTHHEYDKTMGLTADLLLNKLLTHLPISARSSHHVVYFDNYFASIKTLKNLAASNIRTVSTHKAGKKHTTASLEKKSVSEVSNIFPLHPPKKPELMQRGSVVAVETKEPILAGDRTPYRVGAYVYMDSKPVSMLASAYVKGLDDDESTVPRRISGGRERVDQSSFSVHQKYSENYGGVDRFDQDVAQFAIPITPQRWYLRLFFFLLVSITHNMWVIAQHHMQDDSSFYNRFKTGGEGKRQKRRDFQLHVANDLLLRANAMCLSDPAQAGEWQPKRDRTRGVYATYIEQSNKRERLTKHIASKIASGEGDAMRRRAQEYVRSPDSTLLPTMPPAPAPHPPAESLMDRQLKMLAFVAGGDVPSEPKITSPRVKRHKPNAPAIGAAGPAASPAAADHGEFAAMPGKRKRCAGCLNIQNMMKETSEEIPPRWNPSNVARGCSVCKKHVCRTCERIWSHTHRSIICEPSLLDPPFSSWREYLEHLPR